jgi:V/A-type H+-transporting ATPase subunit K
MTVRTHWILALATLAVTTVAAATLTLLAAWPALAADAAPAAASSPALGALAEKPDLFGRVLVIVGLAEGIAIYGLIVSILILNRLG